MNPPVAGLPRRPIAIACCAVLLASIIGLAVLFLLSLSAARDNLARAAISQGQLAAVARIEAALADGGDPQALDTLLDAYRASIRQESSDLASPAGRPAELLENRRADRLAALAGRPLTADGRREIRRLVAIISAGEQTEAGDVAMRMERLRSHMTILAILLSGAAVSSAAIGGFALLAANRGLSRQVAIRTEKLATIERSRRLFFAKVSHELRTPITVMRGEADVALSDPHPSIGSMREALGHVIANADFLEHRVEELLALARTDSGELALQCDPIDLAVVVADAVRSTSAYACSLDVALDAMPMKGPVLLRGDERWLQQALVAVLDNAIKFSPPNATVSLRSVAAGDRASIQIADRGPGITPGALPHIFEAYYQAEEGRGRGGTGLGLALARWIVERHGGTIGAHNDAEGGCVMTIDLPLAR